MLKLELTLLSVPFIHFDFRILYTKIRMVGKIFNASDDSIVDLLFLLLILLNNDTMTYRHTCLIFIELNFGHYFILFWVVKCQLTFPLFFSFLKSYIVTLVYSYKVFEQH